MVAQNRFHWTVKHWKAKHKNVTNIEFYWQVIVKSNMLALQNAPMGAFCNASMLHLEINRQGQRMYTIDGSVQNYA